MDGRLLTRRLAGRTLRESFGARVARWSRLARRIGSGAVELVYPAACVGCGTELDSAPAPGHQDLICRACLERLALFDGALCSRCGATVVANGDRDECPRCRGVKLWFDETAALGEYDGLLREWVLEMKDHRGDRLALALAELVWERCGERLRASQPDVVVPVAMHWRRRCSRGTNGAAIMAERLARRLGVPLAVGLLRRERNTPPQFTLPPSQRRANVRGAFSVNAGYHLSRARVLVVDDILTTGATCSEAARVLKRSGAAYVAAVVAARTLRH